MSKRIKIPLTSASPISVDPEIWPVIAVARDHDGREHESQANRKWRLTVRRHDDGRSIVYGWSSSQYAGEKSRDAGEVVPADGDVIGAIRRTAEAIGRDDLAQECAQDLPAVEL